MSEEEQLVAYAAYCGISVDELITYLDCFEARKLIGLSERDMTPQQQMGAILGRWCGSCRQIRHAKYCRPGEPLCTECQRLIG